MVRTHRYEEPHIKGLTFERLRATALGFEVEHFWQQDGNEAADLPDLEGSCIFQSQG